MGLLFIVTVVGIRESLGLEGIEGVVSGGLVAGARRKLEGLGGIWSSLLEGLGGIWSSLLEGLGGMLEGWKEKLGSNGKGWEGRLGSNGHVTWLVSWGESL